VNQKQRELSLRSALTLAFCGVPGVVVAQGTQDAYFRAVAGFFDVPPSEVAILGDWPLPPDEIPVALFLARRAGVSPEAVVQLRRGGRDWAQLSARYRVDAAQLYVPLPDAAPAGVLQEAYDHYRAIPAASWSQVPLGDRDVVGLVNLRLLAQTLRMDPAEVLRAAGAGGSWAALYSRLIARH
jgi:hypothetical protein